MNVSRRLPDNTVNQKEINQQCICMTSAGVKTSFAYRKLVDTLENSIIDPKNNFCFGCDYRVPILHGLLDKTYINKLRTSPSYDEESFAREYGSEWSGSSDESWYNYDKLQKYRKLKNPEWVAKYRGDTKVFYLFSVDVGRIHDQTVITVFRVNIGPQKFYYTVVNIIVIGRTPETKPFSVQARDIKRLINLYSPRNIIIDTNGLGVGLADEIIRTQTDVDGSVLPAYGFDNALGFDSDYIKIQPKDAIKLFTGIKANGTLKSQINGNAYSTLSSGKVRFLIKEQEAKAALLSTQTGQKMSTEKRVKRLLPHEMTTRLFDEMANLRIKRTGVDIVLEQINSHYPDDKYYSFVYGLWRLKGLEEEYYKKKRFSAGGNRRLVFFTGGK